MEKKIKSRAVYRIDVPPEGAYEDFRDAERITYSRIIYDENGNVLEDHKFDDFGQMTGKSVFGYDEHGKLISDQTYGETGELEEKLTFERDENGRVVREYVHYLDGTKDTITYEYDENWHLIGKTLRDEDGVIEREEKARYDGDRLISEEIFEEGELVKKSEFKYDTKGNVIEAKTLNEDEEATLVNEFDDHGNRIQYLKYDAGDNLVEKHQMKYDNDNRLVEIREEDPFKQNTIEIGYDEKGNAVSQKEVNREGELGHELERDYDPFGNVTEVRASIAGQGQMPPRKYILVYEYAFFD